jgi:hypothetical protein
MRTEQVFEIHAQMQPKYNHRKYNQLSFWFVQIYHLITTNCVPSIPCVFRIIFLCFTSGVVGNIEQPHLLWDSLDPAFFCLKLTY